MIKKNKKAKQETGKELANIDESQLTPYEREERYLATLDKNEKRNYLRTKKAVKRSQWLMEYWVIVVVAIIAFVAVAVTTIILTFNLGNKNNDEDEENLDMRYRIERLYDY